MEKVKGLIPKGFKRIAVSETNRGEIKGEVFYHADNQEFFFKFGARLAGPLTKEDLATMSRMVDDIMWMVKTGRITYIEG